jgi:hypothetical protein
VQTDRRGAPNSGRGKVCRPTAEDGLSRRSVGNKLGHHH